MKKVGLFGGTFNPIHKGHLQLAEAARLEYQLDEVLFVPAASPPHKDQRGLVSYDHRAEMVRLACERRSGFSCTLIEQGLPSPTYTVDTVYALQRTFVSKTLLYFLIGVDAFLEIMSWRKYQKVLSEVNFVLCPRQLFDQEAILGIMHKLDYLNVQGVWQHPSYRDIFELTTVPDEISSTYIRQMLSTGTLVDDLVDSKVAQYIKKNNLYISCL